MAVTRLKFAQLDDVGLDKVHTMEEQTGSVVLVMEKVFPIARLEEAQVEKIRELENELGVILIAIQA